MFCLLWQIWYIQMWDENADGWFFHIYVKIVSRWKVAPDAGQIAYATWRPAVHFIYGVTFNSNDSDFK